MHPCKTYLTRACCVGGPNSSRLMLEPAEMPAGTTAPGWGGPVEGTEELPEPPWRERSMMHEAGHAVLGAMLGVAVEGVQVAGSPLCSFAPGSLSALPNTHRAMVVAAGWVAQGMRPYWRDVPDDDELTEHAAAIRRGSFGRCDRCQVFLLLFIECGTEVSDQRLLTLYSSVESKTKAVFERPDVWAAVSEIVDHLWIHGVIDGNTVHEIVERHVPSGSIALEGL